MSAACDGITDWIKFVILTTNCIFMIQGTLRKSDMVRSVSEKNSREKCENKTKLNTVVRRLSMHQELSCSIRSAVRTASKAVPGSAWRPLPTEFCWIALCIAFNLPLQEKTERV